MLGSSSLQLLLPGALWFPFSLWDTRLIVICGPCSCSPHLSLCPGSTHLRPHCPNQLRPVTLYCSPSRDPRVCVSLFVIILFISLSRLCPVVCVLRSLQNQGVCCLFATLPWCPAQHVTRCQICLAALGGPPSVGRLASASLRASESHPAEIQGPTCSPLGEQGQPGLRYSPRLRPRPGQGWWQQGEVECSPLTEERGRWGTHLHKN